MFYSEKFLWWMQAAFYDGKITTSDGMEWSYLEAIIVSHEAWGCHEPNKTTWHRVYRVLWLNSRTLNSRLALVFHIGQHHSFIVNLMIIMAPHMKKSVQKCALNRQNANDNFLDGHPTCASAPRFLFLYLGGPWCSWAWQVFPRSHKYCQPMASSCPTIFCPWCLQQMGVRSPPQLNCRLKTDTKTTLVWSFNTQRP